MSDLKQKVETFANALESKHEVILELFYRKPIAEEDPGSVLIASILVKKGERGLGTGTAVMQQIVDFADDNRLILLLTPSKDFGATSVDRLRKFYGRFGFKRNLGRHKDYTFSEAMIRLPVGFKR